jgi:hypothetical protein
MRLFLHDVYYSMAPQYVALMTGSGEKPQTRSQATTLSICVLFAGRLGQKAGEKPREGEKEVDAEMQGANEEAHAEAEVEGQEEMEEPDGGAAAKDASEQPAPHAGRVISML